MEALIFATLLIALAAWSTASWLRRNRPRQQRLQHPYRKVIFLDIDGVLHRGFSESLEHRADFGKILRRHPDASVVVSSDWRRGRTLELFRPGNAHLLLTDRRAGLTRADLGTLHVWLTTP